MTGVEAFGGERPVGAALRPVNVWLAGPTSVVSEGLQRVFEPVPVLRFRGSVPATLADLAEVVHRDDIVLIDPHGIEDWEGLLIWAGRTGVRLVAFADRVSEVVLVRSFQEGLCGHLPTTVDPDRLASAVAVIAEEHHVAGEPAAPRPACVGGPGADGDPRAWPGAGLGLTRRESEVFVALGDGLSNAEIAERLILGEETVRTHLRALYRKLGVRDRCAAVAAGLRLGILE